MIKTSIKFFLLLFIILYVTSFTVHAQAPNGTYVPITDMAKQLQFAKLEFSGNKVKIYMGINGISMGVAQEYVYSISGSTLSIKDGNTSVEYLSYDKAKDQITYSLEASYQLLAQFGAMFGQAIGQKVSSEQIIAEFKKLGIQPPVWGKEGTSYLPPAQPKPTTPVLNKAESTVCGGNNYTITWKPAINATKYSIYYEYNGDKSMSMWDETNKTEWTLKNVSNIDGKLTVKIFAKNDSGESEPLIVNVQVTKIPTLATPKVIGTTSIEIEGCNTITLSWASVPNAQFYIVNWSLNEMQGSSTVNATQTDIILPVGDKTLNMYVDVYACANYCNKWIQSSSPLKYSITIKSKPIPPPSPDGYNPCTFYIPKSRCSEENNSNENIAKALKEFFTKTISGGSSFIEIASVATGGEAIKLFGNAEGIWLKGSSEFLNNYIGKEFGYGMIKYTDLSDFGKVSVFLKKAGFYASLLNYGTKTIDVISYWASTGCGESAIRWVACEATKTGITALAGWAAGAAVTAISGGSGIFVISITKAVAGAGVGIILDKLIDCKP